jgi:hypothetical protein
MLGTFSGERQQFRHRSDLFGRLQKSLPQHAPERRPARLTGDNHIDTPPAQLIGKHYQLGGLAAAVYALKCYEFTQQKSYSAGGFLS